MKAQDRAQAARDERILQQGIHRGRIIGNRDARFTEAALREAIEMIRFAHHHHAFPDDYCTPANCSVAEWLDTHTDEASPSEPETGK